MNHYFVSAFAGEDNCDCHFHIVANADTPEQAVRKVLNDRLSDGIKSFGRIEGVFIRDGGKIRFEVRDRKPGALDNPPKAVFIVTMAVSINSTIELQS